ncbi:transposase [Paenibacillus sp. S3N08]|uniref:Transposase n=2 Tax=Paenibacillus agricola TaxID=2716264 RepID=A0ABX0J8H6_9BACL|nr:transposase [Paenibacillus agricola]
MHYLYFTRPEISSFRELARQLKDPEDQAWRNFIGVCSIEKVPVHSCLSNFRVKFSAELFYAILFDLIAQALKLKDFLLPTLRCIDSRPVWANVNGYKHKRCSCPDQSSCACEKMYSDPDARSAYSERRQTRTSFYRLPQALHCLPQSERPNRLILNHSAQ